MPFAERRLLRHAVATIRYRGRRALERAPDGFARFDPGEEARTPLEILRHMNDLLAWSRLLVEVGRSPLERTGDDDWDRAVKRFEERLDELDRSLATAGEPRESPERLLQGPLADVLTHVGQLTLLRRLAGSPLERHSYYRALIRVPDAE